MCWIHHVAVALVVNKVVTAEIVDTAVVAALVIDVATRAIVGKVSGPLVLVHTETLPVSTLLACTFASGIGHGKGLLTTFVSGGGWCSADTSMGELEVKDREESVGSSGRSCGAAF